MAEGFAKHLGRGKLEVRSAGTKPANKVAGLAIEVMQEKGIDISRQKPKALSAGMVEWADILISMGCGVEKSCPAVYIDLFDDWEIEDPYGGTIEEYRNARDLIENKIRRLVKENQ